MDKMNQNTIAKKIADTKVAMEQERKKEVEQAKHFPYTMCEEYEKRAQKIEEKLNIKEQNERIRKLGKYQSPMSLVEK